MATRFSTLKTVFLALSISSLVIFAGCLQSSSSQVSGTISPPNGLGLGGSDDGIVVTFIEVENDSRCAEGLQCVTAGTADVRLGISVNSSSNSGDTPPVEEVTLEFGAGIEATYEIGDYTIELLSLMPDPPPESGVEQSDYQLNLSISRDR